MFSSNSSSNKTASYWAIENSDFRGTGANQEIGDPSRAARHLSGFLCGCLISAVLSRFGLFGATQTKRWPTAECQGEHRQCHPLFGLEKGHREGGDLIEQRMREKNEEGWEVLDISTKDNSYYYYQSGTSGGRAELGFP